MPTNVYANNDEICSKGSNGMAMAAVPDPCFTPPPTPAGVEVVVPYPSNVAMASDLDKGSSKVLICGKMVCLEKTSHLKKSMGDEAAIPSTMKGGVLSKKTQGKAYFSTWSGDVKYEGKGVCRHMDSTTHNHGSNPGNALNGKNTSGAIPPWNCEAINDSIELIKEDCGIKEKTSGGKKFFSISKNKCGALSRSIASVRDTKKRHEKNAYEKSHSDTDLSSDSEYINICTEIKEKEQKAIAQLAEELGLKNDQYTYENYGSVFADTMADQAKENKCIQAIRCQLAPYKQTDSAHKNRSTVKCCPGQSGHHVIPGDLAQDIGCLNYSQNGTNEQKKLYKQAPVVCVEGENHSHGTHGKIHSDLSRLIQEKAQDGPVKCSDIYGIAAKSVQESVQCDSSCIEKQLKEGKDECECGKAKPLNGNDGKGGKIDMDGTRGGGSEKSSSV